MEIIIYIYLIISGIHAFVTFLYLLDKEIKGVDNFWDWVIYNIFWIVQPIKAIIKFFKNIL